ncbi:DUF1217 domain-containing protein [Methylocapsa sp. S129]|uniref:DUF1217 domain-containing protein n=1 Tax=Methylocapsa sp. S129 TaxID=1641869 RepID=UPI00131D7986|nr:DUF1217 domain-containing protein [Methylocapsa sp. S129]
MTNTTSTYLTVMQNLPKMQAMTAANPAVKTASAYYAANIGKVTSIDDFVGNYRLLSYALDAYGLGDQINSTALIKQVLEGGVSNSKSLANTLPQWTAFATAFNFAANGASSVSTSTAIATTESNYDEQQLESNEGQQDIGVQLALYFNRVAPTVTNAYGILANQNLLEVVETIFGLPSSFSAENIDVQAKTLNNLFKISDLQDPAKLQQLTERFTAAYDMTYGGSSSSTTSLTVSGSSSSSSSSTPSAAITILSGIISSNSSSSSSIFSNALLESLQSFTLGG